MFVPPKNWTGLVAWIEDVGQDMRSHGVGRGGFDHSIPRRCDTLSAVGDMLREAQKPHLAEIEQATWRLANGGEAGWPELSPPAAGLLRLRLETAEMMARQLPGTPIPYPDVPFAEFVHWLLDAWWERTGIERAADELAVTWAWGDKLPE